MTYKASLQEDELADSTDWLNTPIPRLSHVDSALRCQVCREFYNTPMITSCSHTFCSLCIRRCLSNDGKCPACKANDQESKLRQNWAVAELVEAFGNARQEVLDFARKPSHDSSNKRKHENEESPKEDSPMKRTRASGRTTRSTPQPITIQDSDEDYSPEDDPNDGLAACPVCSGRMTIQAVEAHIDSCTGVPPTQKPSLQAPKTITSISNAISKPTPKPKALPHPHYASIKDVQLRKKLSDQGLFAGGSRPQIEKRWSEFVIANNANCDAKNPKSRGELRRQMEVWEKTQGGIDREGAQIKDKNFDGLAWGAKHGNAFTDLTALARSKISKSKPQSEPPLESQLGGLQHKAQSPVGGQNPTDASIPIANTYSSPYKDPTAHITIDYHTDYAKLSPLTQPSHVFPTEAASYQNLPTNSKPHVRSIQEPLVSQTAEENSLPPSSQLQQTPTNVPNSESPYS